MALSPGSRLGPYEVGAPLGAGGMGEVYQATDTKLARQVAIKVLPESVAGNPERLARFDREARTLAALNHPNIAHVYGLEEGPAEAGRHVRALVMELVEGPTLADRIVHGALPLDEALPIARQIVEALEAAHEKGIIHRDLKPANVKVRSDGAVKVLDFGLAKMNDPNVSNDPNDPNDPNASLSPTITTPAMTQAGVILGTAAYMAPEQARGKTVDTRADIWAFGAVLHEMLSGRRAFDGEDAAEVLGAVVRLDPDLGALPPSVPPRLRQLIRACLQKNVKQRIAHMQDVRLALDGAFETAGEPAGVMSTAPVAPLWRRALPLAATAVIVAALAGSAGWTLRPDGPRPVTRSVYTLPEGRRFLNPVRNVVAIDPAGRRFVYNSSSGLISHSLDSLEDQTLISLSGGLIYSPFFSPNGESVGYFDLARRQLLRISLSGGASLPLTTVNGGWEASWEADGTILYSQNDGIWQVSENGGEAHRLIATKAGEQVFSPRHLPGGDWILFTVTRGTSGTDDQSEIVVESPSSSERRVLRKGGADARYVPTGHLVYARSTVLYAATFDGSTLAMGAPVPVLQSVQRASTGNSSNAFYSFSSNGTLVYARGTNVAETSTLAWVDSTGQRQPLGLSPGQYQHPRLSPDGRWLAVERLGGDMTNIWLYETSGATAERRLTEGGNNRFPVWSRDGQSLVFQSDRNGDRAIFRQRADGTGSAERLTMPDRGTMHIPEAWSPVEDRLMFSVLSEGNAELWTWTLTGPKTARVGTLQSTAPFDTVFSPDGKWIAYTERATAGTATYVQGVTAGNRYQVGSNDDLVHHPIWSHDQKRLIYFPSGNAAVSVTFRTTPTVAFGRPEPLPGSGLPVNVQPNSLVNHDVAPDGRLVTIVFGGETGQARPEIVVVQNWFEELKRLVPVK